MPKHIYYGPLLGQTFGGAARTSPLPKDRSELEAAVARFMARGGKVTRCKPRSRP